VTASSTAQADQLLHSHSSQRDLQISHDRLISDLKSLYDSKLAQQASDLAGLQSANQDLQKSIAEKADQVKSLEENLREVKERCGHLEREIEVKQSEKSAAITDAER
jgi:peptidoglycan hydrolase CwlO-like protein